MFRLFGVVFVAIVVAFAAYMWNEARNEGSWEQAGKKLEIRVKNWAREWEHYFE